MDILVTVECKKCIIIPIIILLVIAGVSYAIFLSLNNSSNEVFLATTTSVENTGLLDYLIELFEDQSDLNVSYLAVGSGAAIQLGRDGQVDAILVHAPSLEQELIDDGYVINRTELWFNFFIIIGPSDDPAGLKQAKNATHAFSLIYESGENGEVTFYSRGDESGTHQKEKLIWQIANLEISASLDWYFETGTGMSATIVTANDDPKGYTLTDLGTFATLMGSETSLQMVELFSGDNLFYNPYSYLIIDPERIGVDLNTHGARQFLDFLTDPQTMEKVENYKVNGITLFNPIEDS